jgi:YVTN family beta-propeller protein
VAVTPDGASVYVTNELSHDVAIIDARGGAIQATLRAASPFSVAVSPNGNRTYVTNLGPGTLTVIDNRIHGVSSTVSLGPYGTDPFTARATDHAVYVANQGANTLSVIDPRNLEVVATVATGNSPYGIAVIQCPRQ